MAAGTRPCVPQLSLTVGKAALTASLVPPGETWMGEQPPHARVRITRPFYLGIYPVTQAQWWAVLRQKPSQFRGPNRPAERTSYDDCLEFCERLSEQSGRTARLPTEAEWEHACRAGTSTTFHSGDRKEDGRRVASWRASETHAVGQKQPNAWGLYDMHGNVWEWTADGGGPPALDGAADPANVGPAGSRISKGGCYSNSPVGAGSRNTLESGRRYGFLGSRVLVEWEPPS